MRMSVCIHTRVYVYVCAHAHGIRNKKEARRRQTTIGILRKTLNINRESEGVSRRFIRVFVHGGESFAVCQRF